MFVWARVRAHVHTRARGGVGGGGGNLSVCVPDPVSGQRSRKVAHPSFPDALLSSLHA